MEIPCVLMRGGTSKGIFLHEKDLSEEEAKRKEILLSLMGSPDPRQIDGLGGGDPLTSRVAIISPSSREDIDIEFTFALVHINQPIIEFTGTCGNLIAAVGPFAVDEGLVEITEPITSVSILDKNTGLRVIAKVPVKKGKAETRGSFSISGVQKSGAKIALHFLHPIGTITGKLLPTGSVKDLLTVDEETYEVSFVDAVDPAIFIKAKDIGLTGEELSQDIDHREDLLLKLEAIRKKGAEAFHLKPSGYLPKIVFVAPPKDKNIATLSARMLSLGKLHKAYAVSTSICTGIAAQIPGTVVNEVASLKKGVKKVVLSHPSGSMEVSAEVVIQKGQIEVKEAILGRTARRLFKGIAFL